MDSDKSKTQEQKMTTNSDKVAVVLIARNEEEIISKTIKHLLEQELLPYRIIVVNDGSTDRTGEVASQFSSVEVINRERREESFLAKKELAETVNVGLKKLHDDKKCEFVCIMGSDILFPKNYFSTIIRRMKLNPKIAIASGIIKNEFSIEPRGAGRVVRCDFWRKLGLVYPVNYGWEGYLILKAQSLGYEITSYSDLISISQRKTGKRFDSKRYFYYGLGLKALGYSFVYTLAKVLLFSKRDFKGAYNMLRGYLSDYDNLYEPELREYVRKTQLNNIITLNSNYLKRFFNTLRKAK
jgi:glycosyltransferase involved in cell wall biosynthesis